MKFPAAVLVAVAALLAIAIIPLSAAAKGDATTVTIKGPNGDFSGKVKSGNPECKSNRTVKVFKKRKRKKDKKIGTDTSDSNGLWSTGNSGFKKGKFYAKAPASGPCEKGKSTTIKIG